MKTDLSILKEMKETYPDLNIEENPDMSKYTSFRAGGRAAALVIADCESQLSAILQCLNENKTPHIILGNGSNTLFADEGYDGVVIKLGRDFEKITFDGTKVTCGCSLLLSAMAKGMMERELTGFEFASGIPGSFGGALFMNAGAYGGEMKDVVVSVKAMSSDGTEIKTFSGEEMGFGYRHSVLQDNNYIALEGVVQLEKGEKEAIRETMADLTHRRNTKQPMDYPSAGSTFKRPEGYFAGKLIEDSGMKGISVGGAQVSTLHSGFVINKGGATATDIVQLIKLIQNTVYDKFGVRLQPEVRIIGSQGYENK